MSRQFNGKMQHFTNAKCKYSSIGRALDFHSKGCEFEPRYLLKFIKQMNKRILTQIPIEEIKQLASQVNSYSKLIIGLGCTKNGGNQQTIKKIVEENNIDVSHFTYGKCESEKDKCIFCGKEIRKGGKYCSNTCRAKHEEQDKIKKWKAGELDGLIGANNDIATYVKHYLFDKYNSSCQICGWNTVNKYTGKVPLQIHHIDGDCTNNSEENLQLLCPNCHSLTENFGSRNINCTRIDTRIR